MSQRLKNLQNQLNAQERNLMLKWRKQYPICRKQVRNLIYGQKYANLVDQCFDVIIKNRHIFEHADIEEYQRQQQRQKAFKMLVTYHKLRPVHAKNYTTDPHAISITAHSIYNFDPGLSVKTDISIFLYAKTILNYGNINNRALNFQDVGCFGLTQIGHGSNVKGIQTQAIYDRKTKQFILNTPTKNAMKFWIGAAAQLANMCTIWAQLILDGKSYGPHPFVVPIRDIKTHDLLPGIQIGDCGHKNGCNNIDNGYILLKNVRIPKQYALDRLSGINDKQQFFSVVQNPDKRFGLYMNPLSVGRSFVAANAITASASALAIAIRYTAQRRQFSGPKQNQQRIILQYPLTKYRLMPLLAKNYIYFFGGLNILKLYDNHMKQLVQPNNKILNEMHAISGICKCQSSWLSIQTITECRQMLGGHGYSSYSRLGRLFNDVDVNTTWEGDNHMLLQQTTKYILKSASKIQRGKMFEKSILLFLKQEITLPQKLQDSHFDDLDILQKIIQQRLSLTIQQTMAYMFKLKGDNLKDIDIWNYLQPYYGKKMAFIFGDLYYFNAIKGKILQMSQELKKITENCIKLWLLETIQKQRWDNIQTRKIIQDKILQLCEWLTPRSISLIDSIAAPSQIIGSPFADQQGNGMKKYVNLLFTGKNTFKRVDWYGKIIQARNNIQTQTQK